ncbi:class I adenylate-forming enzyme family protein [Spongiibacter tropicus]|uniref:class I adenylate-forming enzyme family protein n=1 Tax=Spongiibacter tropicus TaxID=454602 RepID=UPI0003B3B267|nr:AMP-binding protein [Spongiibacter tropicus]
MGSTLAEVFDWWATERRDELAIVTATERVTYGEFYQWSQAVADWLIEQGVELGDRVTILATNCLDWLVMSQGCMLAGAILAPINPRFTVSEVRYLVGERYQSKWVFYDDARAELAREVANGLVDCQAAPLSTVRQLREQPASGRSRPPLGPDTEVVIIPTSGSTGYPKGVVYSHRSLTAYASDIAITMPFVPAYPAKTLVFGPFCTSAGYVVATQYFAYGATVYVEEAFEPERAIDIIEGERITALNGAPIFFERMMQSPRFASADLSSLRLANVGGAQVAKSLLDTWLAKDVTLRQLYGQTEAGGQATVNTDRGALHSPEKCGKGSVFTRIAIKDDKGAFCPPNTPGEIVIRGPGMMLRYWNDPEATAKALVDGWLHTGDLGMVDEDGLLTMLDRLKDIIISGGINISAAELERVIAEIPGVKEVAVLAAKDDKFGETPLAIIHGEALSVETVLAHCNREMSAYKVPRYIAFEAEPLPRLATGKIAKPALRERYAAAHLELEKVR